MLEQANELLEGKDFQGSYDLLAKIIDYPEARELVNTNKNLAKIRNDRFKKGTKIYLGEKEERA